MPHSLSLERAVRMHHDSRSSWGMCTTESERLARSNEETISKGFCRPRDLAMSLRTLGVAVAVSATTVGRRSNRSMNALISR